MSDEKIVIEIAADGRTVRVEGQGFSGPDCERLSAGILAALGETLSVEHKPEYFETQSHGRTVER